MFITFAFNIQVDLVPFLLTDTLKTTFEVGIEFDVEFKPEYKDLENPTTKVFVSKVQNAVSTIL